MSEELDHKKDFASTLTEAERETFLAGRRVPEFFPLLVRFQQWMMRVRGGQNPGYTVTYPNFSFLLVDQTTDATPAELRPAKFFPEMAVAVSDQLRREFARVHGLYSFGFRIANNPQDRQPWELGINFRDTIPEAPGALAYHTDLNGVPDIEIGVDLFSDITSTQQGILSGLDHEILELLLSPGANTWTSLSDGSGIAVAKEACDKVQNTGYKATNGGWLSNFLYPSYFIPGSTGQYDHLSLLKDRKDNSLGYEIEAWDPQEIQNAMKDRNRHGAMANGRLIVVQGHEKMTELGVRRKRHPHSRTYRLGGRI